VLRGKPELSGLPSARGEAGETLELELADEVSGLRVVLSYTPHEAENVLARHVRIQNDGERALALDRVMSASVDLEAGELDTLTLTGGWARERHVSRSPLGTGIFGTESTRGTSSHVANPFIALAERNADEGHGDVYAAVLVYSGNFLAEVDATLPQSPRLNIGINPFEFRWQLDPGEVFTSPEALLVYSGDGLSGMSRCFHSVIEECIVPEHWTRRERPVVLNSWEAQYFRVDEEAFLELADSAADVGVECVVLDDGWFGTRNADDSSLGDWRENPQKLPSGIDGLANEVHARGLGFGLWVEPEMVSPVSELYRAHPDWCLHIPGRERGAEAPLGRNQLVLDLSRKEVQDWMIDTFSDLFRRARLDYVKWDMNRYLAPVASPALPAERRGEVAHRYVLGLYRVLAVLRDRFPDVLFESCAGGGGRFDAGMLAFMPQTWTSDNTDAVSRLFVQYGTSFVFPPVTMGAHVSAVPNHQVGRTTPLATRGAAAMSASFGYEADLREWSDDDRDEVRRQIEFYRRFRALIQFGRFTRLESPFEGNRAAWMFADEEARQALLFVFRIRGESSVAELPLKLRDLAAGGLYEVSQAYGDASPAHREDGAGAAGVNGIHSAAELGNSGLPVRLPVGDYVSRVYYLRRVD
jgi:alpha-galactosidase